MSGGANPSVLMRVLPSLISLWCFLTSKEHFTEEKAKKGNLLDHQRSSIRVEEMQKVVIYIAFDLTYETFV